MSGTTDFDEESSRRNYTAPYTSKHPIPTIQKYREHRGELDAQEKQAEKAQHSEADDGKVKRAVGAVKRIFKDEDEPISTHHPYPTTNLNTQQSDKDEQAEDNAPQPPPKDAKDTSANGSKSQDPRQPDQKSSKNDGQSKQSATESASPKVDPKQKRKDMKHMKRDDGGREVTDPVTHLPLIIRDSTNKDLDHAPENVPAPGSESRTQTGLTGASKSQTELNQEEDELQKDYNAMKKVFPPPNFDDTKAELVRTYQLALTIGLGSVVVLAMLAMVVLQLLGVRQQGSSARSGRWSESFLSQRSARVFIPVSITVILSSIVGGALITGIRGWLGKKVQEIWDDEVWDSARQEEVQANESDSHLPESVAWLNSLLSSVWPLINPDLFTSVADMLEDVMQASLPKLVRMVSVDDLGQGSEAIRILGIRWLPTGAASQSVGDDGNLKPAEENEKESDRTVPGEGQVEDNADDKQDGKDGKEDKEGSKKNPAKEKEDEQEKEAMRQGMEAEQGDFVNLELAFAYRARSSGKSLKTKANNAHLYLKFYFPGNIAIPVWVELRGIIGTMRLRLQLTPDPPFFSLCTLTFLGQPKADLSCVPLSKHNLNIMDVPLISGFVNSAIDAALAEYVAPKSLTLDLKDMLVGDDFKKDTAARGVIAVFVKCAQDFKEGDGGIGPMKGSSDSYVTVSWGKFGKPMSSTRIIVDDQQPIWNEWSYILVGPEELNAEETLRLQLWDSDKYTADDDLGRIEVPLKDLMHNSKTQNKICDRQDRFTAEDPDEEMPGTLKWSVGYFTKTGITDEQLSQQTEDKNIKTKEDLKKKVSETAERKLREATIKDESRELQRQKVQDYKEQEDALIISAPPDPEYPSGMFSIQIHNITGLEMERLRKRQGHKGGAEQEDSAEGADDDNLPSSYCSVILNHQKIYRTRTKPKNTKPFFNAGTERFIKDWRTAEVIVSVRDAREGEQDALLGVVYLPLAKLFEKRSQINENYPLAGGIGFGRARISMVFRSTKLHMQKELLGWDYGTLEVKSPIKAKGSLHDDLKGLRMRLRSNIAKERFASDHGDGEWKPKRDKSSVFLAVKKRYACPLTIEWRKSTLGPDSSPAFAVLWLKDIPDEEDTPVTLKVWKGGKDAFKRASSCDQYNDFDGEKGKPEQIGEIELTLKFWRGLSGYHRKWADKSKSNEVSNVMEVLDVVGDIEGDAQEPGENHEGQHYHNGGSESDSSDDSDDEEGGLKGKMEKMLGMDGKSGHEGGVKGKLKSAMDSHNDPDDGSRGAIAQIRDYKDHSKTLHRQHRGIMQWRGARKLDWMLGKVKQTEGKVEGIFKHGEREPGVETEV